MLSVLYEASIKNRKVLENYVDVEAMLDMDLDVKFA